jgi:hypothetical protein
MIPSVIQPYVICQSVAPQLPEIHTFTSILARCYYSLNATSSSVFIGLSWPIISAVPQSGAADKQFHRRLVRAVQARVFEGLNEIGSSRHCLYTFVLSVHFGTLVIGRHGIDKAMCGLKRLDYSITGESRLGKWAEGVHYDLP